MPMCFIVSPIGELGSEIRRNADDLRDLIIKPILEPLGFTVLRGDHRSEAGQIDIDVIHEVQEADLCIIDLSLPNPNVYYEFGRRDETGKPLILLKAKGSEELPVDVATRRYIEYDLDSRRGIIDASEQLRNFVQPIIKNGFESNGRSASLSEICEILRRVERKIDRIQGRDKTADSYVDTMFGSDSERNVDPVDMINYSLSNHNIPMAEKAMQLLSFRMDHYQWLDKVVEQVAALGSNKAGDILIENAEDFIDHVESVKGKLDYISCLVHNLSKTDRGLANLELVERLCQNINAISKHEDPLLRIQIPNQLNRLYYSIYLETDDSSWLDKAINVQRKALEICETAGFMHYNLAMCLRENNANDDLAEALDHTLRAIELDSDEPDSDHFELACKIMHDLNDERVCDYLDLLEQFNPIKAKLLRSKWNR